MFPSVTNDASNFQDINFFKSTVFENGQITRQLVNVDLIADKDSFNWHTFGRGDSHILGKKVLCLIQFSLLVSSESTLKFIAVVLFFSYF